MNTANQTSVITTAEALVTSDTLHAMEDVITQHNQTVAHADADTLEALTTIVENSHTETMEPKAADAGIVEVPITTLVDTTTTAKTKVTAAAKKAEKGPSKADTVYAMVEANFKAVATGTAISRAEMIRKIEKEADMHNAGASTYFYNASQKVKTAMGGTLPQLPRAVVASAKVAPTTPIVAAAQTTAQ